ncbi:MAG: DUF5694 domain-containing protein [Flavobacteriales bacterium]|nr:DUF5694 domain-containing protein [Flavobacteriales bacterium]
MKKSFLFFAVYLLTSCAAFSQQTIAVDPDTFLIGDKTLPKVLLVGAWHFNYPGLDAHVTDESNRINIYSEKRQAEIAELNAYLALFKPTKIIVEAGRNTGYLRFNYNEWKAGREELYANESSQIGMRLVDQFGLDTIYGCDAMGLLTELYYDSLLQEIPYLDAIAERHYFGGDDEISQRYTAFYNYQEAYDLEHTMLESFKFLNSDKVLDRYWGAYIAGGQFPSPGFEGADALSMFWFNRNLRIYRNIQSIEVDGDDRILVLYGAGHVGILKWLFETSPEYDLVKFNELDAFEIGGTR